MATEDTNARLVRESRDGVRSVQFFVAAMAAQLRELHDKLDEVELVATGGGAPAELVSRLEAERDAAAREAGDLRARVDSLEHQVQTLREELERQHVTFADHHAARQEIARLQAELQSGRAGETSALAEGDEPDGRKLWPF